MYNKNGCGQGGVYQLGRGMWVCLLWSLNRFQKVEAYGAFQVTYAIYMNFDLHRHRASRVVLIPLEGVHMSCSFC